MASGGTSPSLKNNRLIIPVKNFWAAEKMPQPSTKSDESPLRTTFNLLISGHTSERLGADKARVLERLNEVLDAIRETFSSRADRRLRVWTGLSEGTDDAAIEWARRNSVSLYCVAASASSLPEGFDQHHARVIAITGQATEDDRDPLWVQASDEYKLSMADAVVVVWDGDKARSASGGAVRILAEALRRRVPVLWIDLQGQCRLSAPFDPEVSSPIRLDLVDPLVPQTLEPLFNPPWPDFEGKPQRLEQQLKPLLSTTEFARMSDLLGEKDDPGKDPKLAGFWHMGFFRLLNPMERRWKVRWRETVGAYRGDEKQKFVRGSGLDEQSFWTRMFDPIDRAAKHAANRYRDGIVLSHLLSSMAVLGAVAGTIGWLGLDDWAWALVELVALLAIGVIVRRGNARGRQAIRDLFLRTRRAAEALRLSALLYPFLASLPELHRGLWQVADEGKSGKRQIVLSRPADWLALQALRDAEPPSPEPHLQANTSAENKQTPQPYILSEQQEALTKHLTLFIDDQVDYHEGNAKKYETTHHRLHRLTQSVYYLVLAVVVAHVLELGIEGLWHDEHNLLTSFAHVWAEQHWLILITAFFPALAGALHGILSTLEFQRIAKASDQTALKLEQIKASLERTKERTDKTLINLRAHALLTAQVAFAEHDSWSNLMAAQNLSIPA